MYDIIVGVVRGQQKTISIERSVILPSLSLTLALISQLVMVDGRGSMDSTVSDSRPNHVLPFDILTRVFSYTLGTVWWSSPIYPYIRSLFRLAHVDKHWRGVCLDSIPLWSTIAINRGIKLDFLAYCLDRTGNAPLHLQILFSRPGAEPINLILAALTGYDHRMETLYLSVGSPELADAVAPFFNSATLSAVRSLAIDCGPREMRRTCTDSTFFNLSRNAPMLEALRVRCAWFSLARAQSFSCLRILVIRDIILRYSPTVADWLVIQSTAVCLERIALQNVGCRGATLLCPTLHFAALTHLDVLFTNRSTGLVDLIRAFRAPALTYISFVGQPVELLQSILRPASTGSRLQHLAIHFSHFDIKGLRCLFSSVPRLKTLDVRTGDTDVLDVISGKENLDGIPLCLDLKVLFLSHAGTVHVRNFLTSRSKKLGRRAELSHVLFRNPLENRPSYDLDLEWLRDNTILSQPSLSFHIGYGLTNPTNLSMNISPNECSASLCVAFWASLRNQYSLSVSRLSVFEGVAFRSFGIASSGHVVLNIASGLRAYVYVSGVWVPWGRTITIASTLLLFCCVTLYCGGVCNLITRQLKVITVENSPVIRGCRAVFGGGPSRIISGRIIEPYIINSNGIKSWQHMEYLFEFQCKSVDLPSILARHKNCIGARLPMERLADRLTKYDVLVAAKAHVLWIPQRLSADQCRLRLKGHKCTKCEDVVSVFKNIAVYSSGIGLSATRNFLLDLWVCETLNASLKIIAPPSVLELSEKLVVLYAAVWSL
ncbi:hypothetical protein C8F04DRAFT_1189857 [Mycena alexandri]|uniref:Uncharacterized protein n=1 Tax=Mycena alexandri TaxID=1745969 RepID=A0AAD6SGQ0_9AGAR|nr:hypothetical protein C8F04DRAFT_1189857 [Mycena alexandri]